MADPMKVEVVSPEQVLYSGEATMVILEGATGREEGHFALPAPADDCFLFADLVGRGRRADLLHPRRKA